MTRIIAGEFGGRRLIVASDATRPTSDRVREALFAAIDARVDLSGMTVLDLYVTVVSRFGPWRECFYQAAPRMTPVVCGYSTRRR